eukprot:5262741-Prymnesium_polylepis.1
MRWAGRQHRGNAPTQGQRGNTGAARPREVRCGAHVLALRRLVARVPRKGQFCTARAGAARGA